jgi:flagellar protein FliJ
VTKYRLQALLEIRERAEEEAKENFARAQQMLRQEQEYLAQLQQELKDMIAERQRRRQEYADKLASGEMKVHEQSGAHRYLARMKEAEAEQQTKIDGQQEQVREAEKYVQQMQHALVIASQELKALQKHKEKWEEERRRERMMKEEQMLDEIAQTIHLQKSRGL